MYTSLWRFCHVFLVINNMSALFKVLILLFCIYLSLNIFLSLWFFFSSCLNTLRWYLFEETALCLWTGVLYISYLKAHITRVWYDILIIEAPRFLKSSFAKSSLGESYAHEYLGGGEGFTSLCMPIIIFLCQRSPCLVLGDSWHKVKANCSIYTLNLSWGLP